MLTAADLDDCVQAEFGPRLAAHGFEAVGRRRWVRATKLPIREIFEIRALKGAIYCPRWGLSCGIIPTRSGQRFVRQASAKSASVDLVIDPVADRGRVPRAAYSFLTGYDQRLPSRRIRRCAKRFIPRALADFDPVDSVESFCDLFERRSRVRHEPLGFFGCIPHRLTAGIVTILRGDPDRGIDEIRRQCDELKIDPDDDILREAIEQARRRRISQD